MHIDTELDINIDGCIDVLFLLIDFERRRKKEEEEEEEEEEDKFPTILAECAALIPPLLLLWMLGVVITIQSQSWLPR